MKTDPTQVRFFQGVGGPPLTMFADKERTTPLATPVLANADGLFPEIWMPLGLRHTIDIQAEDSQGKVLWRMAIEPKGCITSIVPNLKTVPYLEA